MRKILLLTSVVLMLCSCESTQSKQFFILSPQAPPRPIFVVIPVNKYLYQIEFANKIEEAVIHAGIRTKTYYQKEKEVTTEETVDKAQASVDATKSGEKIEGQVQAGAMGARKTTKTVEFDGVDADYLIETNREYNRIKIIKLDTHEVLVSANVSFYGGPLRDEIYDFLKAVGIPVRENYVYYSTIDAKYRKLNPIFKGK